MVGVAWMVDAIASTTRNRIEAMTLAERIVLSLELFEQPANTFAGDYLWGVRPEHFYPAGPDEDSILAAIDVVQPTGSRTYGSFALADAHVVAELEAHALDPNVRQKIPLGVALDRTAFFDLETGDALARPRP